MDQNIEIIKRLEDENLLLKKQLLQFKDEEIEFEKEHETVIRLAESEGIFRSIFENSLDGIILIGEDCIIKEWNRGFEDMLGISKEEAVGRNLWDVFNLILEHDTYSKDEIEDIRTKLNAVIAREQQTNFVRKIVNLQTREERIIHTLYFPVYQSETCTMCIICRDVTPNVNKEKEVITDKERLQVQVNILR